MTTSASKPPAYTMTNESITVIHNGRPHVVKAGAANFANLRKALTDERWDEVPGYLTVAKTVASWSNDKFKVDDNTVSYLGKAVDSKFAKRILDMVAEGSDPNPLFNFYERLQRNPSKRSVDQLWPFLEHAGIPLILDGCFYAYKGVKDNWKDVHSGTIENKPGNIIEIPRNSVSDDPKEACHFGLHVGAKRYANSFGSKLIIVKVDPEHVVCVPYDSSHEKMRVCKYEVIGVEGCELPSTVFEEDKKEPSDGYEEYEASVDQEAAAEEAHEDDAPSDFDGEEDTNEGEDVEIDVSDEDDVKVVETKPSKEGKPGARITKPKKKADKKAFQKYRRMGPEKLINLSLDDLRKYATYGLDMVGASKVPGGKTALIQKILRARK